MQNMTLDQLKREMDALLSRFLDLERGATGPVEDNPFWQPYRFAKQTLDVATKHGLNAAMLYKLSGGNIDPRKP